MRDAFFDRARLWAGACAFGIGAAAAFGAACGGVASRSGPGSASSLFSPQPSRALGASEKAVLDREGLVLTSTNPSPEQSTSFHLGYTAIFHAHQPVYITADTFLYAWHASYDQVLADLEEAGMAPTLTALIDELRASLARAPVDRAGRAELDLLLTVAARLVGGKGEGKAEPPVAGADAAAIAAIVSQAERAEGIGKVPLGGGFELDYSMLKPRGHYTRSEALERYFRAMAWLGRVELRIANPDPTGALRLDRDMLAAVTLLRSLVTPKSDALWRALDTTTEAIAGPSDSMSLRGVDTALSTLGVRDASEVARATDASILAAFSPLARQRINTQLVVSHGPTLPLSLAFVLLGQRYVFDAHVLGNVTYGRLAEKRMMPSPLDVAAAVFDNKSARALLAPEVTRFGASYRDALEAMTTERRRNEAALWKGSVYHLWLSALGELSPDAERDARLPSPLTSEAWSRRMLATQLASWAELRHDNLLYAKQSVTGIPGCEYPDAYVEPYPRFFATLEEMAAKGKSFVERFPLPNGANGAALKARMSGWFDHFAKVSARLREIAERERRSEPLTAADLDFLNRMVRVEGKDAVCTIVAEPEGWHADLYYDKQSALYHQPIVADVHTQPADELGAIVGKVLHVGTASPRMLVVTLRHDGGAHAATYRGFVSSYAEATTEKFQRMTDDDWRVRISKERPAPPPWLKSLVVE